MHCSSQQRFELRLGADKGYWVYIFNTMPQIGRKTRVNVHWVRRKHCPCCQKNGVCWVLEYECGHAHEQGRGKAVEHNVGCVIPARARSKHMRQGMQKINTRRMQHRIDMTRRCREIVLSVATRKATDSKPPKQSKRTRTRPARAP